MAQKNVSNSSHVFQPWKIVKYPESDLTNLTAPAWVDSPDVRGTFDILQSCILTLVACIYTALHLDVPIKTAWHEVLLYKLKWTAITLFAPEISLYMAADQLQQAWSLKAKLRALQTTSPSDKDHVSSVPDHITGHGSDSSALLSRSLSICLMPFLSSWVVFESMLTTCYHSLTFTTKLPDTSTLRTVHILCD